MLAIKRFISNVWLAATPPMILLVLISAFAIVTIVSEIIARLAGAQAADNFVANVAMLFGMLVLFTPLVALVYALVSIVRWQRGGARS